MTTVQPKLVDVSMMAAQPKVIGVSKMAALLKVIGIIQDGREGEEKEGTCRIMDY